MLVENIGSTAIGLGNKYLVPGATAFVPDGDISLIQEIANINGLRILSPMKRNKIWAARNFGMVLPNPLRINVGCGYVLKTDWVGLDINGNIVGHLKNKGGFAIQCDIVRGLPFDNKTVDFIFSEHFIEHLGKNEQKFYLSDAFRVLKNGGVIRTGSPCIERGIERYVNREWRDTLKKDAGIHLEYEAEGLNMMFHSWGHKFVPDYEYLSGVLKKIGFTKILRCDYGKSGHVSLSNLEHRHSTPLIVEATKP